MANKKEKILIFIPILILIIITIFISTSDKKVYIRKNSSYAAGSTTLNGYSIDSVTISSNNSNNIDLYYYPSDLSLGGGITYKSSCWGHANYNISGLDSSKVYKASVHIKTTDLTSSSSYGATLGTARSITGFSNIVFSWSESVIGTSEKDVDLFFVPDNNGTATITIGNAVYGYGGSVKGTIEYNNLSIEEATSDDITIYNSKNNKIKMIMRNSDYNKLDSMVNNKEQATQNFIDKLEEVYNAYAELAGQNSSGHGLLYPYRGMAEVLMYTNKHNYGAIAGYPIEFNWNASDQIADYANNNTIGWGEIHELGHTFDEPLSTLDGFYNTNKKSQRMWDFNGEFWANMKAMYAIDQGILKTPDDMYKLFENTFNTTLGKANNKTFAHDALIYLFMQTKNSSGQIDWEAMKKAFKWFNDLKSVSFLNSNDEKFGWYIKKYNEYRTYGHESIYNILSSDQEILDTVLNNFSYIKPTYIELWEDKIFLTEEEEYEIDPDYSENATNADITYESSNPEVATVDDFGNIKAISEGKATIKVYSFFNPKLVKTINVTVTNSNIVSFVTNCDEQISDYVLDETSILQLPLLEKEGYTLKAWFSDPDFIDKIGTPGESVEIDESMVLYAKWVKKKYTIKFNSDGGTPVDEMTAKYESAIAEPESPTKEGYVFSGWYEDKGLTKPYAFSTMPSRDLVLHAKWMKEEYIVNFDSNGGTQVEPIKSYYQDNIEEPEIPTKEGYAFEGWYTDSNLTNKYDFNSEILSNITLYAKWTEAKYTIKFNSDGGTPVDEITAKYESAIAEPESPTKEGYVFSGWYEDKGLTKPYAFSTMPSRDLVLHAKWMKEEYIVNFDSNGGTQVEPIKSYYQDNIEEPEIPTKEGYAFEGWYTDSNLTNKYDFNSKILSNITLYGKWAKDKYTISFNSNGGTAVKSITNYYEEEVIEPSIPTKVGHTFTGWYKDEELTQLYTFSTIPSQNIILYAGWIKNKYIISFNSNGGTIVNSITKYYKEKLIEPILPVKEGYTFAGWYEDGKLTKKYLFDTVLAKDITLYAKWNKNEVKKPVSPVNNKYTISFNSNGGTTVNNIIGYYKDKLIEPAVPTRIGYTFVGWYEDTKLTKKYLFNTMPNKNITLYAKWAKNKYVISFNSNGGNSIEQIILEYKKELKDLEIPTRKGYIFAGWFKDQELTNEFNLKTMPSEDIILYAKWEIGKPEINKLDAEDNIVLNKRKSNYTLTLYKNTLKLPEYYEVKVRSKDRELTETDLISTGSITYIYVNGKEVSKYTNIVKGDTNKDGLITIEDIDNISDYIIKGKGLTEKIQKKAADVVEDDRIKLSDVVAVYEDMEAE